MSSILETVDQRTQMVGQNRLELLLFRLTGGQLYGINVFKVKEVLQCPKLNLLPQRHPVVRGVAHLRGGTIPVLDLNMAIGQPPLENIDDCFVIITEYNMMVQGFLVSAVDRIVNTNWEDIHPPPKGTGKNSYLTAVTDLGGKLVEIIDVEKVLSEVSPRPEVVSDEIVKAGEKAKEHVTAHDLSVLIVDDSMVARKQVKSVVSGLGFNTIVKNDGKSAFEYLKDLAESGIDVSRHLALIISDIEMPEMDGYTLTTAIRNDPRMEGLYIILHTSLSGVFNKAMVEKVGANDFLAKFRPDDLATAVTDRVEYLLEHQ